jgi:ubiquitin-conjugating enzyme E2 S
MTSIHAPIPQGMIEAVLEAKRRGEDPGTTVRLDEDPQIQTVKGATRTTSLVMKKKQAAPTAQESEQTTDSREEAVQSDADMEAEDPKENDPSLSPSPVTIPPPPSPRKNVLGKRPLSVLATRLPDADVVMGDDSDSDEHTFDGMTASERNVAANKSANSSFTQGFSSSSSTSSTDNLFQKSSSPKSFTFGDSDTTMAPPSSSYAIYEDGQDSIAHLHTRCISHGKENLTTTAGFLQTRKEPSAGGGSGVVVQKNHPSSIPLGVSSVATHHNVVAAAAGKPLAPGKITKPTVSGGIGGRKTSYSVARGKPRVGVRRL